MTNAVSQLDVAATRLARATTNLSNPDQSGDVVQLSDEIVAMMGAKNMLQANAKVVQMMDEVQQSTLSLLG